MLKSREGLLSVVGDEVPCLENVAPLPDKLAAVDARGSRGASLVPDAVDAFALPLVIGRL